MEAHILVTSRDLSTPSPQWFASTTNMPLVPRIRGAITPRSNISLAADDARQLIDDLWHMGIRPTHFKGSSDMDQHLQDMRTIVFDKLKIERPK